MLAGRMFSGLFMFALGLVAWSAPAPAAQRFALIMGVNEYRPPISALAGAENDARALREALIERWHFDADNIRLLLGTDASKLGVLNAVTGILSESSPGDHVLVYFAGHGTSAADRSFGAALPHTTGALVPADFALGLASPEQSLIVGRSDLRPLLEALDRGDRKVLVVFDSCFSGNAVRGRSSGLIGRPPLPNRNVDLGGVSQAPDASKPAIESAEYPYRNVVFFAAAAEHEVAADIPTDYLQWYPTRDNQAHGAFTDALLRALHGELPGADVDGDGALSHHELFQATRGFVQTRGYPQSPQLLPGAGHPAEPRLMEPVLGLSGIALGAAERQAEPARVAVHGLGEAERALLAARKDLVITEQQPGYVLRKQDAGYQLLSAGGDALHPEQDPLSLEEAVTVVTTRQRIGHLLASGQGKLRLSLAGEGFGHSRIEGQKVAFRLALQEPAWTVVFNLSPKGRVQPIFPFDDDEFVRLPAGRVIELGDSRVTPPFGSDWVVAIGFRDKPEQLVRFLGRELSPGGEDLAQFLALIEGTPRAGMATVDLFTAARPR